MNWRHRDPGIQVLLDLDGQVLVVDAKGGYWVRFAVDAVSFTPERPHGLKYSLTLHGPDGSRLIGFDNAHPVRESLGPGGKAEGLWITSIGWKLSVPIGQRRGHAH
jgi:hypothetical protein